MGKRYAVRRGGQGCNSTLPVNELDICATSEEIVQVLASYIYNIWSRNQALSYNHSKRIFDTMSCKPARMVAEVLASIDLLKPLDRDGRQFIFTCKPSDFVSHSKANTLSQDVEDSLIAAAVAIARYDGPREAGLLSCLINLGICKPVEFKTKTLAGTRIKVTDFEVAWTTNSIPYDRLFEQWFVKANTKMHIDGNRP